MITTEKPSSAEWERAWEELTVHEGGALDDEWRWIGIQDAGNGVKFHLFRHTTHSKTRRTTVVKIQAFI